MPLTMAMAARLIRMPGCSYMQWWHMDGNNVNSDDDNRDDDVLDENDDPIEKNESIFKGK